MHFTFACFGANESDTRFTGEGTGKQEKGKKETGFTDSNQKPLLCPYI